MEDMKEVVVNECIVYGYNCPYCENWVELTDEPDEGDEVFCPYCRKSSICSEVE